MLEYVRSIQREVRRWCIACFGEEISNDKKERNHRFLEEAIELVQSTGCTKDEALDLVEYVFERPIGETKQEVGGVMVTLAALCNAHTIDMIDAAWVEIRRIWTKVEAIRAKQQAKPKFGPRPGEYPKEGQ